MPSYSRVSGKLRDLGVRYVVDPSNSHHDSRRPGEHFLYVEYLDEGPPLCTLQPIVGIVAHDQVSFVHRELAPFLVQQKPTRNEDTTYRNLWGARVAIVCVAPPHPSCFGQYVMRWVYGCACECCRRDCDDTNQVALYMQGGTMETSDWQRSSGQDGD